MTESELIRQYLIDGWVPGSIANAMEKRGVRFTGRMRANEHGRIWYQTATVAPGAY